MRWWDTLTQQFTHLASQAAQSVQSVGDSVGESMDMIQQAQAAATKVTAKEARQAATTVKVKAADKPVAKKKPAQKTAAKSARRSKPDQP